LGIEITASGVASLPGSARGLKPLLGSAGGVASLPGSAGGVSSSGGSPTGVAATVIVPVADSSVVGSPAPAFISAARVRALGATTRVDALASVVEASVRSRLESRASLLGPGVDVATVEVMLPSPAPPPPVGLTGDVTASIADAWPPMSRNVSP
jgi:hypothetical protein